MALPVSPAPRSEDIAVHGWHGITVRVAWTLLALGIKVRPAVLRDAREHVLLHLDKATSLPIAEDLATQLAARYVARARGRWTADPWAQDAAMPLSPRWRRAVERAIDPVGDLVFRKHFGDGRPLEWIESRHGVDRLALEGARSGLREVIRRQAGIDGVPLAEWPSERLDRTIGRLAAWSPGPCPPLLELLEGAHREHTVGCTRCDRTVRLVRGEVLTPEDLVPPSLGARPDKTASVLLLQVHPDGRRHRAALARELPAPVLLLGEDLLALDGATAGDAARALVLAAELGVPGRDHVRGAVVEGPGAWSRQGLLGPLLDRGEAEARLRPWGTVDGIGELPGSIPEPPSARSWWMGVAVLAAMGLALLRWSTLPAEAATDRGLDVAFTEGRGGIWAEFDVDETAVVTVVRLTGDGELEVVSAGEGAGDKAIFATGDGRFRLHAPGRGVLLVATERPLVGLRSLLDAAQQRPDPLAELATAIAAAAPNADVRLERR
jgi:hypothetical protein